MAVEGQKAKTMGALPATSLSLAKRSTPGAASIGVSRPGRWMAPAPPWSTRPTGCSARAVAAIHKPPAIKQARERRRGTDLPGMPRRPIRIYSGIIAAAASGFRDHVDAKEIG